MCGIVGAVSTRNIVPILVQGLQRLEYRGYDSCGVAVHAADASGPGTRLQRLRGIARVADLAAQAESQPLAGHTGIAHTRWATHGVPAVTNAHPHVSRGPVPGGMGGDEAAARPARVTLVHNGIIENHEALRAELLARGYFFASQTDTEVIVHLIDSLYDGDLFAAVQAAAAQLRGSYSIAVLHRDEPQRLVGARQGSPLVLGVGGDGKENFLASDAMALAGVTDQIVYLEEGDVVDLQLGKHWINDRQGQRVQRPVRTVQAMSGAAETCGSPPEPASVEAELARLRGERDAALRGLVPLLSRPLVQALDELVCIAFLEDALDRLGRFQFVESLRGGRQRVRFAAKLANVIVVQQFTLIRDKHHHRLLAGNAVYVFDGSAPVFLDLPGKVAPYRYAATDEDGRYQHKPRHLGARSRQQRRQQRQRQ